MKHVLFTTLFAICLYVANAGIIVLNWPYMDAANNCIIGHGDPDGNNKADIHFTIYLKSSSSYSNNSNLFDSGLYKLGILVSTSFYEQFIPISDFEEVFSASSSLFLYSQNISVPHFSNPAAGSGSTFGTPSGSNYHLTFEYSVSVGYQHIDPSITNNIPFTNNNLFLEYPPTPMNPAGSNSEVAIKDVCSLFTPLSGIRNLRLSGNYEGHNKNTLESNDIEISEKFNSSKAYPNPFTQDFTIQYRIEQSQDVSIEVFDAHGALKYVQNEYYNEGFYEKNINEITLPKGIYFCCLKTENNLEIFKLIKTQ